MSVIVIKYGGSLLEEPGHRRAFLKDVAELFKKQDIILVHGGGKEISRQMELAGLKPQFVNGRRFTDEATMAVVKKALSHLNAEIVAELGKLGVPAFGQSGQDDHLMEADVVKELGRVGIPKKVNDAALKTLLNKKAMPVFYSVAEDAHHHSLNINADDFAQALAIGCAAEHLIFLTDSGGVLDKSGQLISLITSQEVKRLIENGTISGGMIVKVQACITALRSGIGQVTIGDHVSHTAQHLVVHGTSFILYNSGMIKSVEKWVRLSDYRIRSADILHESGQHLDAVFNFQQAIEFMLKAWMAHQSKQNPPRTHDLLELAEMVGEIPPAQRQIVDELHDVSVPLRYPDDLDEALQAYTYEEVKRIGQQAKGLLQWLKQKLN